MSAVATESPTDQAPVSEVVESQQDSPFDSEESDETDFSVEVPDLVEPKAEAPEPVEAIAEETTETDTASTAEEIDPTLLTLAEGYDFTAEEAKSLGPVALAAQIRRLDKQAAAYGRAQLESQRVDAPEQPAAPHAPQTELEKAVAVAEKYELNINPDDFDPELVKVLNGFNEHVGAQNAQFKAELRKRDEEIGMLVQILGPMHQQLSEVTGQKQAEGFAQITQDADAFFTNLGDEFADIYGKQPLSQLPKDSPLLANRNKLLMEMYALEHADAQSNRQLPRPVRMKSALLQLHPDKIKQAARKEILGKTKERQKTSIHRPSGKTGPAASGRDKAVAFARQFEIDNAMSEADLAF